MWSLTLTNLSGFTLPSGDQEIFETTLVLKIFEMSIVESSVLELKKYCSC
jgi:hypothetical protein